MVDEQRRPNPRSGRSRRERIVPSERGRDIPQGYLNHIGSVPLLSSAEEQALGRRLDDARGIIQESLLELDFAVEVCLAVRDKLSHKQPKVTEFGALLSIYVEKVPDEEFLCKQALSVLDGARRFWEQASRLAEAGLNRPADSAERREHIRAAAAYRVHCRRLLSTLRFKPSVFSGVKADLKGRVTEIRRLEKKPTTSLLEIRRMLPGTGVSIERLKTVHDRVAKAERQFARARDELVRANLRLAVSIARRYTYSGIPYLDLIQEGNGGLIKAADRFDYRRGCRFSTYATYWVRQAVSRSLSELGNTIRLPNHLAEAARKTAAVSSRLTGRLGRQPTDDELAAEMHISAEHVRELLDLIHEPLSLDLPMTGDPTFKLAELVEQSQIPQPAAALATVRLREQTRRVLAALSPREENVLRLRYGLGGEHARSLAQIGRELSVSSERIRQIERRAVKKLRCICASRGLRNFLED